MKKITINAKKKVLTAKIFNFIFFLILFSAKAQQINLALGKTVTSSSVDNASLPNSNLTDGNFSTVARTGNAEIPPNAEWFVVDLGGDYFIQKISLGAVVPDNTLSRRFMIVTYPSSLSSLGKNPLTYINNNGAAYNKFFYTSPTSSSDYVFGRTSSNPNIPGNAGQTLGPVFEQGIYRLDLGIHKARYIMLLNLQDTKLEFTELQVMGSSVPVRTFKNGGFEQGTTSTQLIYHLIPEATVEGWSTTEGVAGEPDNIANLINAKGGAIELWRTGMNGIPSYEGNYFAELNSYRSSILQQQPICILPNESFNFSLAHRGRSGTDIMRLVVDDLDVAEFSDSNVQTGTHTGTILPAGTTANLILNKDATTATGWTRYYGTWTNTTGVSRQISFGFKAVSSSTGSVIAGNLLDDVKISALNAIMTFDSKNTSGNENVPTANLPKILINGPLSVARTVQIDLGGTATRGSDYTTVPATGPLTINIPAGNYDGTTNTAISLANIIQINQDLISEGTETIIMTLVDPGTGDLQLADTSSCQGAVSSAIYSITDNVCYKNPVTTGNTLATNMGISAFNRAGAGNGDWPMIRKGGYIALESSTMGMVVTRTTKASIGNPVIGMLIYEINDKCLSVYTSTGWKCYQNFSCPD
ncbi:hypothetical protein NZ698_14625 [Chryseobacterium sp. PBS4-4]|uniref:F5/8 type C domain-containing protein n=1 Tax=Chryseobacterium edaphi TaxID=2976532 RepID=A0ABT2W881_9FLAO|nr:hypothetical protein [Chryseobacterium edaphi]MCU7618432.1 hypothetical protein [Chryseobacterium edaphi]